MHGHPWHMAQPSMARARPSMAYGIAIHGTCTAIHGTWHRHPLHMDGVNDTPGTKRGHASSSMWRLNPWAQTRILTLIQACSRPFDMQGIWTCPCCARGEPKNNRPLRTAYEKVSSLAQEQQAPAHSVREGKLTGPRTTGPCAKHTRRYAHRRHLKAKHDAFDQGCTFATKCIFLCMILGKTSLPT
eukprot:1157830-Pelagomonas_calceolata.AAC.6